MINDKIKTEDHPNERAHHGPDFNENRFNRDHITDFEDVARSHNDSVRREHKRHQGRYQGYEHIGDDNE